MYFNKLMVSLMILMFVPGFLYSNERHFGYVYESGVLPSGAREIEVWNTFRTGRDYYYHRFDQRLEFEVGLGSNLMTSLYLNHSSRMADNNGELPGGMLESSNEISISSEWKYKLMDPVADGLGLALYGEGTLGLGETELELKLILDKKIGNFLFAFNAVYEQEWEYELENGETIVATEGAPQFTFGANYHVSPNLSIGVEVKNHNVIVDGEFEHSALFLGPVLAYSAESWWSTLTILPQVASLKGTDKLDLHEYEKIEARLLLSFHL